MLEYKMYGADNKLRRNGAAVIRYFYDETGDRQELESLNHLLKPYKSKAL